MALNFQVRAPKGNKDVADVRYDCACGCHPSAKYPRGAAESAHEHCCCGQVHFAGADAERQLLSYLADRKARGEDADRGAYIVEKTAVKAPWGELIEVAYGTPGVSDSHEGHHH